MRFLAIQVMLGIHMCLMLVVDDDDLMRASVAAFIWQNMKKFTWLS